MLVPVFLCGAVTRVHVLTNHCDKLEEHTDTKVTTKGDVIKVNRNVQSSDITLYLETFAKRLPNHQGVRFHHESKEEARFIMNLILILSPTIVVLQPVTFLHCNKLLLITIMLLDRQCCSKVDRPGNESWFVD